MGISIDLTDNDIAINANVSGWTPGNATISIEIHEIEIHVSVEMAEKLRDAIGDALDKFSQLEGLAELTRESEEMGLYD